MNFPVHAASYRVATACQKLMLAWRFNKCQLIPKNGTCKQ